MKCVVIKPGQNQILKFNVFMRIYISTLTGLLQDNPMGGMCPPVVVCGNA